MKRTHEGGVYREIVLSAISVLVLWSGLALAGSPQSLILTDAASVEELRTLIGVLEEHGAAVHHFFPPGGALGEIPENLDPAAFPGLAHRVLVLRDPALARKEALSGASADFSSEWKRLHGVWERLSEVRVSGIGAELAGDALPPAAALRALGAGPQCSGIAVPAPGHAFSLAAFPYLS